MAELYRAWTRMKDEDPGRNLLLWIPVRAERIRIAAYTELIRDMNDIDPRSHSAAKGYVDEFFTRDEFFRLKDLIEKDSFLSLACTVKSTPIVCTDEENNVLIPYRSRGLENIVPKMLCIKGLISSLPFDVAAYLISGDQF